MSSFYFSGFYLSNIPMNMLKYAFLIVSFICPLISCSLCQESKQRYNEREIIIKFSSKADSSLIDSLCEQMSLEKVKEIPGIKASLYRIKSQQTATTLIEEYKDHPAIEYIEPNYQVNINQ
jgi:hypothetical protein